MTGVGGERRLEVVQVGNRAGGSFTVAHEETLSSLAAAASVAVENG